MSILLRMYPGDAWALLIANVLVQVTVVILAAWLVARVAGRWNAAWRHSIYLVAILCVLASPVLAWAMQASGFVLVTLHPSAPPVPLVEPANIPAVDIPEWLPSEMSSMAPVPASPATPETDSLSEGLLLESPPPTSLADVFRALAAAALVAWLLGIAWLCARWCHGLRLIAALRRAALPLDAGATAGLLDQVRRALGVERLPPVATCADLDRPIMIGLFRPLVILPEHVLPTLHEPELADVLVHECAHAVCRHQVVGFVQRLTGTLFWLHPLVYLLNRELARAREEVCDNYVLRRSAAPRYARTLLELSQLLADVPATPAALGLFPCRWRLEDRVADLLDPRRKAMVQVSRWAAAALTAAFLLLGLLIAGTRATAAPIEEKLAGSGNQDQAAAAPGVEKSGVQPPAAATDGSVGWKVLDRMCGSGSGGYVESKYDSQPGLDLILPAYEWLPSPWPLGELNLSGEQTKQLQELQSTYFDHQLEFAKKAAKSSSGQAAYPQWLREERQAIRKRVEEILTPLQAQTVKEFTFRRQAYRDLSNPQYRKRLGLTVEQDNQWLSFTKEMQRRFEETRDKMLAVLDPRQRALLREEVLGPFGKAEHETLRIQLEADAEVFQVVTLYPFPDFGKDEVQKQLGLTTSQQKQVRDILQGSPSATDRLVQRLLQISYPQERKRLSDDITRWRGGGGSAAAAGLSAEALQKWEAELRRKLRGQRREDKKEWEQYLLVEAAIALRKQFEATLTPEQLTAYQDMAVRRMLPDALHDSVVWEQIGASEEQKQALSRLAHEVSSTGYDAFLQQSVGKMLATLTPAQREKLRQAVEERTSAVGQEPSKQPAAPAPSSSRSSARPAPVSGRTAELLKPIVGRNYLVVPFTTELQRTAQRSYQKATFLVLINGAAMLNEDDTALNVGAVDFRALHDVLQELLRARLLRRVIVMADVGRHKGSSKPGSASLVLHSWLRDVPPTTDFATFLSHRTAKEDWNSLVARLSVPPGAEAIQREAGVGDDLVKIYPICTPLSRLLCESDADCVIYNVKPLDQFTAEDFQAFPAKAKAYASRLNLKPPFKAYFLSNGGLSLIKSNRAWKQLHLGGAPGSSSWWQEQGFRLMGVSIWNDKSVHFPTLLVKVQGEGGIPVKESQVEVTLPAELKRVTPEPQITRQDDGRWRCICLPSGDEFTLTVQAPGYQPASQKILLSEGVTKELEVKLQKQ